MYEVISSAFQNTKCLFGVCVKGGLITEGILTLVPLPTKVAKSLLSRKLIFAHNSKPLLESGIDVGQGINVGPGKFVKKNKRRALNKRRA